MTVAGVGRYRRQYGDEETSADRELLEAGPLIEIAFQLPTTLAAKVRPRRNPRPLQVFGLGQVDPGARLTAIDPSVVKTLGLLPVGTVKIWGHGRNRTVPRYAVNVMFPGTLLPDFESPEICALSLSPPKGYVPDQYSRRVIALIGRDYLRHCVLLYDGPGGTFTLTAGEGVRENAADPGW